MIKRILERLFGRKRPTRIERFALVEIDLIQRWWDGHMMSTAVRTFSGDRLAEGFRAISTYVEESWTRVELIFQDGSGRYYSIRLDPRIGSSNWCMLMVNGAPLLEEPWYSDVAHADRTARAS